MLTGPIRSSVSTQKKELIGDLYRAGALYCREPIETLDHDYPSLAEGVVIPHGIYDMKGNHGYLNLGTSHDTSEFAVDSLRRWWPYRGRYDYPEATSILILCDSGGSNGCRSVLFKVELQRFAEDTGLVIRVAHFFPIRPNTTRSIIAYFPMCTGLARGSSSPVSSASKR